MIPVPPSDVFSIKHERSKTVMIRSVRKNPSSIIDAHSHTPLNRHMPFISRQCVTFSFIAFIALFTPGIQADFKAGASMVDISPTQYPVRVNGSFTERSATEATDKLFAKALALDDGRQQIILCVVDSCMVPRTLIDRAKSDASKTTGYPHESNDGLRDPHSFSTFRHGMPWLPSRSSLCRDASGPHCEVHGKCGQSTQACPHRLGTDGGLEAHIQPSMDQAAGQSLQRPPLVKTTFAHTCIQAMKTRMQQARAAPWIPSFL